MSKKFDKELIMEDLQFIYDYINEMAERHPEINEETGLMVKMYRRLNDIEERVKGA